MHDMAWIIDGTRTMAELQTEATLRGIPTAGIRKEALRREIANHEIARMGTPIVTLPAPVITVPGPMAATEGTAFAQTLMATAGTAPLTWSAVGLPPGLAIDPATGAINGTPTTRGNYNAMVTVRDAATPARSDTQPITFIVAAPAPVPAPIVPLAGFRPRKWTYNRMVNRAPEDWLDAELNAWGLPIVGTVDQKREQLHRQMDNSRPWNRVGHDVPVLPGTPPARAPRNIDFSPLGWAAGALGIVALAAALLFLAILPAAAWGWDHSFGDENNTKVVSNGSNGQNGTNGSNGQNGKVKLGDDGGNTHISRLESLDPSFRSGGWTAWLTAAGVKCDSVRDARQPEEETNPSTGKISVAGVQIVATNCSVPWPNIVTTDVPSRITKTSGTVQYTPDPANGSTLYTNVIANGPVTIWADGSNWGQFTSKLGNPASGTTAQPTAAATTAADSACMSTAQLDSKYGIVRDAQGARNGLLYDGDTLAGAVLKLSADQAADLTSKGWTIQGSNANVKSAWSPNSCRPLS